MIRCAHCGTLYTPGASGVWRHRTIAGHTPAPWTPPPPPPPLHLSLTCADSRHHACLGVVKVNGARETCGCVCHGIGGL
ncbi:hypothetical protein CCO02nite_20410 [Cellulomonas composti]|uniref:Uncharacterized protein n=1 Tax=Cellulomonas composti TaxID=266130 RepID=A0A511JCF2_9CELL|nr:hypothetical protein CCO02nite_20410 [Cellulomonas composti]